MSTKNLYLGSTAMKATASSLELASKVLGFDIVELWNDDKKLHCVYVHATEEIVSQFPSIITGHYPTHKREHQITPLLCKELIESKKQYLWRVEPTAGVGAHVPLTFNTQLVYMLDKENTNGINVFIVCLSLEKIKFEQSKLKYLTGLAFSIYVAAVDLDDDGDEMAERESEMDFKSFIPKNIASSASLQMLDNNGNDGYMDYHRNRSASSMSDHVGLPLNDSDHGSDFRRDRAGSRLPQVLEETGKAKSETLAPREKLLPTITSKSENISSVKAGQVASTIQTTQLPYLPPTWDPSTDFNYSVAKIAPKSEMPVNLTMDDFSELKHLTDGSNANVYLARYQNDKVIIKMIKVEAQFDPIALHEFDLEHGMLSRMSHPNIIKVLGAGSHPRRFIVLEWLGGGTLGTLLNANQQGLANRLFRKPTFTYASLLSKARDMAEALDYLHSKCHPGATIIHRDLKPDNIGFTADGSLKLFDFGLCTCVKARTSSAQAYEMTGFTGSLRYMAPEVALRKAYNEKVDVYSFAIIVWQMARDRIPFKGFTKEEFMKQLVSEGQRPKLDKNWPPKFSKLLEHCWDDDHMKRPSFTVIVLELNKLIAELEGEGDWPKSRMTFRQSSGTETHSWF